LLRSIEILTRLTGTRPVGFRAPWFEINPWTPELLVKHNLAYCASEMGDDVPYFHDNGLVEIPGHGCWKTGNNLPSTPIRRGFRSGKL